MYDSAALSFVKWAATFLSPSICDDIDWAILNHSGLGHENTILPLLYISAHLPSVVDRKSLAERSASFHDKTVCINNIVF